MIFPVVILSSDKNLKVFSNDFALASIEFKVEKFKNTSDDINPIMTRVTSNSIRVKPLDLL